MFENMGNMFNGMFGKIGDNMCRLTMNGNIAIKTSNGYKTYNLAKKRLTNVSSFCFDAGDFFFVMPTSKVKVGDIILVNGKPKCVIKTETDNEDNAIKVIDYETSEVREVIPERHVFMGSTYFYGKIVSMFGAGKLTGKGVMGKVMNMMMIKSMFGGNKSGSNDMFGGGLGQMMLMQQMFGKGDEGNMFENMFGLEFGEDEDEVDCSDFCEDESDEDEAPAPKKKSKK